MSALFSLSTIIAYNLLILWPAYAHGWPLSLIVLIYLSESICAFVHLTGHQWVAVRLGLRSCGLVFKLPPFQHTRISRFTLSSREQSSLGVANYQHRSPRTRLNILAAGWLCSVVSVIAGFGTLLMLPDTSLTIVRDFLALSSHGDSVPQLSPATAVLCFTFVSCCRAVFALLPYNSSDGSKTLQALLEINNAAYSAARIRWSVIGISGYALSLVSAVLGVTKSIGVVNFVGWYVLSILGPVSVSLLSSVSMMFSKLDDYESDVLL